MAFQNLEHAVGGVPFLPEMPKCKVCSNAADTLKDGIWYCESHTPTGETLFVPRVIH